MESGKDEGEGYYSLKAYGPLHFDLAYIALPTNHPDVGKGYDSFDPDVNGGLTFAAGNVFGWDYGHAYNRLDIAGDIVRALTYFRSHV